MQKPIYLGFAAASVLLAFVVGLAYLSNVRVVELADRLVSLRMPTANTSTALTTETYGVQQAFSQWVIDGDPRTKAEVSAHWDEIDGVLKRLDALSTNWTNPENRQRLERMHRILDQLKAEHTAAMAGGVSDLAIEDTVLLSQRVSGLTDQVLAELIGAAGQSTDRMGGMRGDQQALLRNDILGVQQDMERGEMILLFLLLVGLTLIGFIGRYTGGATKKSVETAWARVKESEDRALTLIDTAVDAIILIDEAGTVSTFNAAAEKLFGYQSAEVIGNNIKMLMPDPYHSEHDDYLCNYITTGVRKIIGIGREVEGKRKDGSTFPMDLAVSEMYIGGQRLFTGYARDISERQAAGNALAENEQRIRAILDTAVDGIISIDEMGKVESFNPAAESLFGYRADEVIGQNVRLLMPEPYHGEHDGYLDNYRTTGVKKIIGIGREVEGQRKDGSTFPLELAVSETQFAGRRLFTGVVRNITERKEAEANLAASEEQLRANMEKTAKIVAEYVTVIGDIATGDLTKRLKLDPNDDSDLTTLGGQLNTMTGNLAGITGKIANATQTLSSTLAEVNASVTEQAATAAEQSASVTETTATLSEIEATAAQTLENAQSLGEAAGRAKKESEQGMQAVDETIEGMEAIRARVEEIAGTILTLSEQSQQIGVISEAVTKLAQQSKILALNASIEAAKAGDAGKGFAVVAMEVKDLADQSQQSIGKIQQILQDIRHATDRAVMVTEEGTKGVDSGVLRVQHTGKVMAELSSVVDETLTATQQIVAAVRQEAAGIKQVTQAMQEIDSGLTQSLAATRQLETANNDMMLTADELKESVSTYRIDT